MKIGAFHTKRFDCRLIVSLSRAPALSFSFSILASSRVNRSFSTRISSVCSDVIRHGWRIRS